MAKLSEILRERGYVYQFSAQKLEEITDGQKRTVYFGIDPTAESLHVGNLAGLMLLRRLGEAGHKVILLLGGGTGMIGDPKPDVERPLLDQNTIAERVEKLETQSRKLLGEGDVQVVDNADWLPELRLIDFLRDVGKYFTVNSLVKKEAIAARMKSDEGISFTEFSYPLLQAYDFWYLYKGYGCDVQIGGSDQWGNIVAGIDLIRRKENKIAYGITLPIIEDKAGKKFGKSEGNAIWLDAGMTSPFAFYQFWFNAGDESVGDYLKIFTMLSMTEIEAAMELHRRDPKERHAQRLLAREVTRLVHSEAPAESSERISQALFGDGALASLEKGDIAAIHSAAPSCEVESGAPLPDVLVAASLASSKREARQFLKDGAISLNGEAADEKRKLKDEDFVNGIALLKRGVRNVCVLVLK